MTDASIAVARKTCAKCKKSKPITEFYKKKGLAFGVRCECKECERSRALAYRNANIEKSRENAKQWKADNKERVREYQRQHYHANPGIYAEYGKASRQRRIDKIRENNRIYYINNKERCREIIRTHYQNNKDRYAANAKKWRENNREKVRSYQSNYLALKMNAAGSHTGEQIENLFSNQRGKCANCKTSIKKGYHKDHIIALSKGGSNDIENIQLLCSTCNLKKNDSCPFKWANMNGRLL